jgi:signal recognition particle GTPase
LKVEISPYISKKLEEIAKTKGISEKEALDELMKENLETMKDSEDKIKKLEENMKRKRQNNSE